MSYECELLLTMNQPVCAYFTISDTNVTCGGYIILCEIRKQISAQSPAQKGCSSLLGIHKDTNSVVKKR